MSILVKPFLYDLIKGIYSLETIQDMLKTFDKEPRETKQANINLLVKFLLNNHYFEENKEYSVEAATKIINDTVANYKNKRYTVNDFESFLEIYSNYKLIEIINDLGFSATRNKNANIKKLKDCY
jgi:oligoribonuclease NrnB/cAMP/cGMP phosphodiesterase (DHH superfamily)